LAWFLVGLLALVLVALAASRATAAPGDLDDEYDDNADSPASGLDDEWPERDLAWADGPNDGAAGDGLVAVPAYAPELSAVIDATLHAAGVSDDPVPGWRARSRWSALIPAITSRIGNSQSWREVDDPTVNRALSYDVRVSWRLERLLYDPNEPRFTAFDVRRRRERRHLRMLATRAYWTWVAAASRITSASDDSNDAPASISPRLPSIMSSLERSGVARRTQRALVRAARAQSELDALTDGWFSDTLAKSAPASRSR